MGGVCKTANIMKKDIMDNSIPMIALRCHHSLLMADFLMPLYLHIYNAYVTQTYKIIYSSNLWESNHRDGPMSHNKGIIFHDLQWNIPYFKCNYIFIYIIYNI